MELDVWEQTLLDIRKAAFKEVWDWMAAIDTHSTKGITRAQYDCPSCMMTLYKRLECGKLPGG